ncbi:glycosyltransferase family 2 protein [Hymenobacter sp. RP-2-7]|uniref:Glycosyltransferase family 2 protein n=1 Tax=Hymenobacter polaris TaxID=2682546 RepID=A0A7Y0AIM2_9BACT|nr:glycosyltransferase [Hymenobacter polaris]NML68061.1 glycosyltransferase family 2 protein [Hymenobacter polaris]
MVEIPNNNLMKDGVSIIVCCYNSAIRLPDTIKHLANQKVAPKIPWEVIIVDNNSTDNTAYVAVEEWKKYDVNAELRVVEQNIAGLSAAREKGIEYSAYNILIFCDDDNWLDSAYVNESYNILSQHTQIAAVGGNNIGVYEETPPAWLKYFEHSYAIGNQAENELQLLGGYRYLVGAGMAFKKDAYNAIKRLNYKFYLTDRIGNKVVGGGDVELCFIFKLAGYQIAASNKLKLHHYMPAGRISKKYLINMWHQYSYSWMVFEGYKACLNKNSNNLFMNKAYWQKIAIEKLFDKFTILPRFLYHRIKNNVVYFLPHEADILYALFLFKHANRVVDVIHELQEKEVNE